jgi:hypothetical protein
MVVAAVAGARPSRLAPRIARRAITHQQPTEALPGQVNELMPANVAPPACSGVASSETFAEHDGRVSAIANTLPLRPTIRIWPSVKHHQSAKALAGMVFEAG